MGILSSLFYKFSVVIVQVPYALFVILKVHGNGRSVPFYSIIFW